jgi:protein-S-isoprenylcysteine O-methyltransferase Ste14
VRVLVLITVAAWLVAELILRIPQRRRAGRTVTREWRSFAGIYIAAALGGILAGLVARHAPFLNLPLRGSWWTVAALAIAWLGIVLRLWSIATLGQYFRPIVHIQQGHQLVRSGPYRVLRHPSYTGLLLGLFGLSLTFANVGAIVVFNGCFLAAVLYRIRVEERFLLDGLGDQYATYMQDTYRLVPGVW